MRPISMTENPARAMTSIARLTYVRLGTIASAGLESPECDSKRSDYCIPSVILVAYLPGKLIRMATEAAR